MIDVVITAYRDQKYPCGSIGLGHLARRNYFTLSQVRIELQRERESDRAVAQGHEWVGIGTPEFPELVNMVKYGDGSYAYV